MPNQVFGIKSLLDAENRLYTIKFIIFISRQQEVSEEKILTFYLQYKMVHYFVKYCLLLITPKLLAYTKILPSLYHQFYHLNCGGGKISRIKRAVFGSKTPFF